MLHRILLRITSPFQNFFSITGVLARYGFLPKVQKTYTKDVNHPGITKPILYTLVAKYRTTLDEIRLNCDYIDNSKLYSFVEPTLFSFISDTSSE